MPFLSFAGNGAYSNASQAQYVPTLNLNPSSSLRFVSGKDTGFVTVTHEGDASNSTSRLVVTYYDSTGTALYFFSKANPRNVPIVPLDEQKLTGVQTTLEIGDGDGPTVSPLVAGEQSCGRLTGSPGDTPALVVSGQ